MMIPVALGSRIKVMQVIATSLMMGLASFLVVVGFLAPSYPAPPEGQLPVLTYIGLALLTAMLPVAFLLPVAMARGPLETALRQAAERPASSPAEEEVLWGQLLAVRQTMLIVGMAPLEGAGFFNAIAFLVEHDPLALGGAIAALILLAMRFPTFASVATWLALQKEALARLRTRPR